MRLLTAHQTGGALHRDIQIEVLDEPGPAGACHDYMVRLGDPVEGSLSAILIPFQKGPVIEAGINGVSHEILLTILIDRLQGFQRGPYACRENALALTKIEEALHWLQSRTQQRLQRGVEGTHAL